MKHYNINLFIEKIPINLNNIYPSDLNIYMPNIELFNYYDEIKYINIVLCKTIQAYEFIEFIKKEHNYKYISYYTKFTTHIMKELKNINPIVKDPNLFIHMAGTSPYKNTASLMYTWIQNNGFLNIDPLIQLHITCYSVCYKILIKKLKEMYNIDMNSYKIINNIMQYKNLYLYTIKLEPELYKKLITTANVAINISRKEGYGHYINEMRYFNTFIITMDSPPMNELVKDNINGILLYNKDNYELKKFTETKYKFYDYYPNIEELKDKIIYCIKNKNKLDVNGISRNMYMEDKQYLYKSMNTIIKNLYVKQKITTRIIIGNNYGGIVTDMNTIKQHKDRYISRYSIPYIMPVERAINIDTKLDLMLAEKIISG